ncbi:selenium metabolism protein YedF [Halanaerobium saccharolyticum]|uniref:Selenium metabolism protein YedF n=1 Tax=Halanaerobium saccharolyticum TaxID=43595 RepID=A0A4R7ZBA7_9FIRM|nr:selenium metabolism protein YedF [Halanaerobium saccharolyticum]TDW07596.1 selenium metabolism protein YedF [Halanaerobium saccharolyticum]TDX64517.1 selenium metabolism protein YedF [Halanaerobium saccharolyticum]
MKEIDAKGLACPKPVVLAKKAITSNQEVLVIVDNQTAASNLTKLGNKMEAEVSVVEESETEFRVMFKKSKSSNSENDESKSESKGAKIYLIPADTMGDGERELGQILIKGFISTIKELDPLPKKIIFLNSGVKLAVKKDVTSYLKELEDKGVEILLCGTCVDYYGLQEEVEVGEISNMFEIADSLNREEAVVI